MVSGSLRATDTLYSTTAQFQILRVPTSSGGTTYGSGSDKQILQSNGTSVYWNSITPSISITAGTSSAAPKVNLTVGGVSGNAQSITTATTSVYGVTKLTDSFTSADGSLAVTGKAVNAALQTLDSTLPSGGSASKTLTALTITDGKMTSATFTDISIDPSQINATIPVSKGGTGINAYTLGDILYSSAANTLSKLSGNTTTTRKFLRSVAATSGTATAPVWDTLTKTDVGLGNVENVSAVAKSGDTMTGSLLIEDTSLQKRIQLSADSINLQYYGQHSGSGQMKWLDKGNISLNSVTENNYTKYKTRISNSDGVIINSELFYGGSSGRINSADLYLDTDFIQLSHSYVNNAESRITMTNDQILSSIYKKTFVAIDNDDGSISGEEQFIAVSSVSINENGMDINGSLSLTNALAISYGGTGATTAVGARTNLDVYSKSEVTSAIAQSTVKIKSSAQTIAGLESVIVTLGSSLADHDSLTGNVRANFTDATLGFNGAICECTIQRHTNGVYLATFITAASDVITDYYYSNTHHWYSSKQSTALVDHGYVENGATFALINGVNEYIIVAQYGTSSGAQALSFTFNVPAELIKYGNYTPTDGYYLSTSSYGFVQIAAGPSGIKLVNFIVSGVEYASTSRMRIYTR